MQPPRPSSHAATPAAAPQVPLHDEIFEEEPFEAKPRVSRADALERMTKALETAKRARDAGKNVSEIRKALKQARASFESGDYDAASRLATEILKELEAIVVSRESTPAFRRSLSHGSASRTRVPPGRAPRTGGREPLPMDRGRTPGLGATSRRRFRRRRGVRTPTRTPPGSRASSGSTGTAGSHRCGAASRRVP